MPRYKIVNPKSQPQARLSLLPYNPETSFATLHFLFVFHVQILSLDGHLHQSNNPISSALVEWGLTRSAHFEGRPRVEINSIDSQRTGIEVCDGVKWILAGLVWCMFMALIQCCRGSWLGSKDSISC